MKQIINGADLRRMIISAAASIEIHKQQLNELNVFPVPDGDTGTNMSMTINSAAADLRKAEDPALDKAAGIAASAMLRGARGNSGVILSLLFRGISKKLKGESDCDGVLWAMALQEGVDAAYKAVMKPAEGTILTVARLAAAKAAQAARENNHIEFVQEAAVAEARIALAGTTDMNPVLKKAGVVDAGGKGWLFAMEAMLSSIQGEDVVVPDGTVTETKARRVTFDKLVIDMDSFELIVDGKKVDTPPKEMELLFYLASSPNRVYTRNQLLDEVWGFDYFGDSRTVDVHVKRLREKLEGVSDKWSLKTVWGVGYKFEVI